MRRSATEKRIYLCTYQLHKDNRIRLPKSIEENLGVSAGETFLDIYVDMSKNEIVLRKSERATAVSNYEK